MTRRLLNLLTALSLVLCAGALVLSVRSYFVRDEFEWIRTNMDDTDAVPQPPFLFQHVRTITSARGGVRFDAATLDISNFFFRSGTWPPPGFTRRSNLVVGRYPTVRPEWQKTPPALRPAVSWGGFEFGASQGQSLPGWLDRRWSLTLPYWSLALLTGALPLWRISLRRRSSRAGFPVALAAPTGSKRE